MKYVNKCDIVRRIPNIVTVKRRLISMATTTRSRTKQKEIKSDHDKKTVKRGS